MKLPRTDFNQESASFLLFDSLRRKWEIIKVFCPRISGNCRAGAGSILLLNLSEPFQLLVLAGLCRMTFVRLDSSLVGALTACTDRQSVF